MKLLFLLYITFFKIGAFAFGGGYAVIPLIQKYIVTDYQWMNMREMVDLISISQMTPGPIAINSATFVGQKMGGIVGSLVATAGIVTPQFILMMIFGYFLFTKHKTFLALDWILNGIKAGIVSLILITAISMFRSSIFPQTLSWNQINVAAAVPFVIGLILYWKKVDLFKLIAIGAILGILLKSLGF